MHSPDALRRAVATEDLAALMMVPGIGKKGAQRIVLELAGRLGSGRDAAASGSGLPGGAAAGIAMAAAARPGTLTWRDQVRTGLTGLGWQAREAEQAVAAVEPDCWPPVRPMRRTAPAIPTLDVAVALRTALRVLGRT